MKKPLLACLVLLSLALTARSAEPAVPKAGPPPSIHRVGPIRVAVVPDHADWNYRPGERVTFTIAVTRDNEPVSGLTLHYRLGPEMTPGNEQSATLPSDGRVAVEAGTKNEPGFLRCIATVTEGDHVYRGLATAGFEPEKIQPTQTEPADFDAFWAANLAALAKIPLDAEMTLQPEACSSTVNVYHVSFRTFSPSGQSARVYGIYCEPKAPGKYPAILRVPGAGVRPYFGQRELAEKGFLTLEIGIHGIPVNLPKPLYDQLRAGALDGYPTFNLDNRDTYYYRRVYLGCVRANDFLVSREKYNGTDLGVVGGSQGGQLSIVTAALDSRVKALASGYPAYCDVTGPLHGRPGGWPHMMRSDPQTGAPSPHATEQKIRTTQYYDTVNFARRLKVPGTYTWGYNDETCPPTSTFSAYNVITAPKVLALDLESGHAPSPEQNADTNEWIEHFFHRP